MLWRIVQWNRMPTPPALIGGFDPIYYLGENPDVAAEGCDPLDHYLHFGWREGRDPSAEFSTRGYLSANPDVARAGVNPLLHYREHGLAERRRGWQKPGAGLRGAPPQLPR
ncbi:hypothetical protein VQ03_14915 [Methylobacterium tarhaniae]|uniref:Uncharacterized protein n=1 Tax=Methylobacterium tarhaniae TaxID=1187852 RepID=A0A0J6T1N7_9HYPH|nr:hypothetical protein [Methylobacterium tarhaniae]KMO39894.1 hypothetical protein VQ03_14915 [Methylobacterium tarhaniae]